MSLSQRFHNVLTWEAVSVGVAAVALSPSLGTNRAAVQITNVSPTQTVYLGYSASVATGFYVKKLAPGEFFEVLAGPVVPLYAVASAAGGSLSIAEVA